MTTQHTGGCFCGAIRYAFTTAKPLVANCHCTMCRRTSAAPFVTWLLVPVEDFRLTAGEPARLQSSEHGEREFCGQCGTPLTCRNSQHPERVDITAGSLDAPEDFPPVAQAHHDTRLSWVSDPTREV